MGIESQFDFITPRWKTKVTERPKQPGIREAVKRLFSEKEYAVVLTKARVEFVTNGEAKPVGLGLEIYTSVTARNAEQAVIKAKKNQGIK